MWSSGTNTMSKSKVRGPRSVLMHWSLRHHTRIEFDLAKGALVSGNVLLQESEQGLRLLRAEVDPLEILNLNLRLGLLLEGAKYEIEIPDVDAHLHAVGVALAIIFGIDQFQIGLRW